MFTYLANRPNRILERQKMVQASTSPLYYRLPRSRFYLAVYFSAFTVGMAGVGYSTLSLVKGKPAST